MLKLKLYDNLLGKCENNDTVSTVLVNCFNEEMYEYLNKIIDDKIVPVYYVDVNDTIYEYKK